MRALNSENLASLENLKYSREREKKPFKTNFTDISSPKHPCLPQNKLEFENMPPLQSVLKCGRKHKAYSVFTDR